MVSLSAFALFQSTASEVQKFKLRHVISTLGRLHILYPASSAILECILDFEGFGLANYYRRQNMRRRREKRREREERVNKEHRL
mmetsp:Transcript_13219/g.38337  ORF Transcript_13219/g.38337 Transcript_13219/m.38337 type:complete len:84 (+) Transcript_13219:1992-2243(+)